ncbi:MAG TPA: HAD family hydrolase [Gemmatimonadaceae bacterium]|nr:HAD family hydrolase [Gemmatimonadaceae bacterium]
MLRAVSFDYWDTLYQGATLPERSMLRRVALRRMLTDIGCEATDEEFAAAYVASGVEAERWWREEQRGYTAAERIRWMLERLDVERPADCPHIALASEAVDEALLCYPPPLLPGAASMVRSLSERYLLAITSDTGFASSRAQDRLLERDGIQPLFAVRTYSMDVGHAKPHPAPFRATIDALGVQPGEVLHVGDNERTDVQGALAAGMRAVRLDVVKENGASDAELVARSFEELEEYLRLGSRE